MLTLGFRAFPKNQSIVYLRLRHRVGYELRFINEHEKASVADFFIPEHRGHGDAFKKSPCPGMKKLVNFNRKIQVYRATILRLI
jgi:hypothetical protein